MSAQRARSTVAAEDRSAHPAIAGVPWWGAIVIAVACIFAGFAIDAGSGHGELTSIFAVLYVMGCIGAVLAVRQSGIFTAVVQPPLILFVAVPTAYYLFHRNEIVGLKDILINCGYPLIERFLLMFTTTVVVLLIGMARWYFGGRAPSARAAKTADKAGPALLAGFGAAFAGLFSRGKREQPARRPRTAEHTSNARPPRQRRTPAEATQSPRTRRPADDEGAPPRRRSSTRTREDGAEPPPRRRRPPRESDPRSTPREYRTRPREDDWSPRAPEPAPRPRRASRYADAYEPYEPYQPPTDYPRREPYAPDTHLPYSKVRYRGDADGGVEDDENRRYRRPR